MINQQFKVVGENPTTYNTVTMDVPDLTGRSDDVYVGTVVQRMTEDVYASVCVHNNLKLIAHAEFDGVEWDTKVNKLYDQQAMDITMQFIIQGGQTK